MSRALLVIDVQKVYTEQDSELYCPDSNETVARVNKLVRSFEERGEPVVYVRHIHKRDGSDLGRMFDFTGEPEDDFNFKEGEDEVSYDERLVRLPDSREVIKNRYSAFAGTDLRSVLRELGVDTVVVCGFMTNFCCDSTAREAHDLDYFVDFVADATGTPGTEEHDETELREIVSGLLSEGYARVWSVQDFLSN